MADRPTARPFTVELRRCLVHSQLESLPVQRQDGSPPTAESVIEDHTALIAEAAAIAQNCELLQLQDEIRLLKQAIEQMKGEIAALRHTKAPAQSLQKATCELDAVVQATEDATHGILAAAERIDEILVDLRAHPDGALPPGPAELINEQIVRIFEACNFQDISGQRINKVVNAMKFIEVRIDRMIEILGGSETLPAPPEVDDQVLVDADAALLEGPQLDNENKISQDDIDRFFS